MARALSVLLLLAAIAKGGGSIFFAATTIAVPIIQIGSSNGQGNVTASALASTAPTAPTALSAPAKPPAFPLCASPSVLPYSPLRVSFVNGIHHSEEEWRNLTLLLSEVFGDQVRAFYNPSSGWWVKDAAKAGYELVRRPNDLGLAKKLAEHLRSVLREVGPTGRVLHLAHSGGAILTYLAAKYHLTSQETDRIDLATFGGGRSITRKYFRGRITNYYSRNDPLTLVDSRAGALMKFAKNTTYCEVRDRKHNTTFVYLQGLADNPLRDHSMFGPTYVMALKLEAANFRHRLSMMATAIAIAEANWVRRLRKATARVTGLRHFWGNSAANVQSSMRVVRKRTAKVTKRRGFFSGKGSSRVSSAVNVTAPSLLRAEAPSPGLSAGGSAGTSWRARALLKMASHIGRYYPSSWLGSVSSSEAFVDEPAGAAAGEPYAGQEAPNSADMAGALVVVKPRFPSLFLALSSFSLDISAMDINSTLASTWASAGATLAFAKTRLLRETRKHVEQGGALLRQQLVRVRGLAYFNRKEVVATLGAATGGDKDLTLTAATGGDKDREAVAEAADSATPVAVAAEGLGLGLVAVAAEAEAAPGASGQEYVAEDPPSTPLNATQQEPPAVSVASEPGADPATQAQGEGATEGEAASAADSQGQQEEAAATLASLVGDEGQQESHIRN